MRYSVLFLFAAILSVLSSQALGAPKSISTKDLLDKIHFHYSSVDGTFQLECKHWIGNINSGDFDIVCGKGTKWMSWYAAHLVIRTYPRGPDTTFEILYWVTDRNTKTQIPAFSSHSQLFTVNAKAKIKEFQMSQSLQNDYAQMRLTYKP